MASERIIAISLVARKPASGQVQKLMCLESQFSDGSETRRLEETNVPLPVAGKCCRFEDRRFKGNSRNIFLHSSAKHSNIPIKQVSLFQTVSYDSTYGTSTKVQTIVGFEIVTFCRFKM